jgi:hypothetical protein
VVACLPNGSGVTLDDGPATALDPNPSIWWHVRGKGWVAHSLLLPAAGG